MATIKLTHTQDARKRGVSDNKGTSTGPAKITRILDFEGDPVELTYYKRRIETYEEFKEFMGEVTQRRSISRACLMGTEPEELPTECIIIYYGLEMYFSFPEHVYVVNNKGKTIDHLILHSHID